VAVVGVLVEAEVGHEHDVGTHVVAQVTQGNLDDAVAGPGLGTLGILGGRDAEEHDAGHAEGAQPGDLLAKRLPAVLDDAGERGDGLGIVDPLAHEQRGHQVVDR
jgi:hypothetical protein